MLEKKFDIIGVGSPVVDSLAHVSEDFVAGISGEKGGMELVSAEQMANMINNIDGEVLQAAGGSAGNTVFGLAKLGLKSAFVGKLGNCEAAAFYRTEFEKLGGDSSRFKIGDIANARCLSLVTPDTERTMRTDLGASAMLAANELSSEDFADARHVHVEGYVLFNRDLMMATLKAAKEAGCTISLDLASFEVVGAAKDILDSILDQYIDVVFANEEEAAAYAGVQVSDQDSVRQLGGKCEIAVVKLGKDGSLIFNNGDLIKIEPVKAQAIDTTGAGDLWATGFLYGWLKGRPLKECGDYGSVVASEVVSILGTSLPDQTWQQRIFPALNLA
ncbi:MAG: adenosine kinase [Verrucomicrobiota bacterium]